MYKTINQTMKMTRTMTMMELEERGLCRQRQQSMDDDNGNTQQSNSTGEKGEKDGANGRTNDPTNK